MQALRRFIPRERWQRRLLVLGPALVVLAVVFAEVWIGRETAGRVFERLDVQSVPVSQVALVLGARVYPDHTPSWTLERRLELALELYRASKVARILVSGDHRQSHYDETNVMLSWLVQRGVPREHVFTDHAGFRTLDTMARAAKVFQVESAVVCTTDFHVGRSVFLARQFGIEAVGLRAADSPVHRRYNRVRETLARTRAVLDIVVGTEPAHLGPPIPIGGSASASHDGELSPGTASGG